MTNFDKAGKTNGGLSEGAERGLVAGKNKQQPRSAPLSAAKGHGQKDETSQRNAAQEREQHEGVAVGCGWQGGRRKGCSGALPG